jgi:putative inorganic carbon (hco3(-)) transporter
MRDLVLSLLVVGSIVWGLISPRVAVLALTWICFQRPQDFSWGLLSNLPLFQVALACTLLSTIVRGEFRPRANSVLVLQLLLLSWITLSTVFAFRPEIAWTFYGMFVPSLIMMPFVLVATIRDLELLKYTMLVAVGAVAINGAKVGLALTLSGGAHITTQISGFVGDNNTFGLILCLVVIMAMGLRRALPDRWWIRYGLYGIAVGNLVCILFTKSRGALLTILVISTIYAVTGKKPVRNLLIGVIVAALFYAVVPAEYFDRMGTLKNVSADESAMGRVENWGLAWKEAVENPIFGVGPDNHITYHKVAGVQVHLRVAHSVYFQTLGELGFPGLVLYLALCLTSFGLAYSTWRRMNAVVVKHPDLVWVQDISFSIMCGLLGYFFGSAFLNVLYIEFPWFVMCMAGLLWPLTVRELKAREEAAAPTGKRRYVIPSSAAGKRGISAGSARRRS